MWVTRAHHIPTGFTRQASQRLVSTNISFDPKQSDLSTANLTENSMLHGKIERALKQLKWIRQITTSKPRVMSKEFKRSRD